MAGNSADPSRGLSKTCAPELLQVGEDMANITVDCLSRKLRATVRVREFDNSGPIFAEHRIQVECAKEEAAGDVENVSAEERKHLAGWLARKLQPQFAFPIEVTTDSASHHGKVLARYAGTDEPARDWQRHYTTFHIDHKQNAASLGEGVQVNVWLNLMDEPISDFALGFLELDGRMIAGNELPLLTQHEAEQLIVRYKAGLAKDQVLIFQSTGAYSVVHGSFRFQDAEKLTHAPRYSLEFRLLLRRFESREEVHVTDAAGT